MIIYPYTPSEESGAAVEAVSVVDSLRDTARKLLESGDVRLVIGYGEGYSSDKAAPIFITDADDAGKLIFDNRCFHNLAVYLRKPEIKSMGRIAIVVKGCDAKAINVLLLENQINREDVVILGMTCRGMGDPVLDKCNSCMVFTPPVYDHLFGEEIESPGWNEDTFARVEELDQMSYSERFEFWNRHFDRCIKCYACREACPICTCTRCITDKNQPQWVPTSTHSLGNFHWNLTRAFHLAGRCVGCNECERACPMDIPLSLINWKLIKAVHDEYEFIAGMNAEDQPPLATYTEGETKDFIG